MNNDLENQLNRAREFASEKAAVASEQIRELSAKARKNAVVIVETSHEKAEDIADEISTRGAKVIQANPLAVVAGGLALGALIGVLLPKTKQRAKTASTLATGLLAAKGMGAAASSEMAKTASRFKTNVQNRLDDINTGTVKAKLGELIHTEAAKEKVGDLIEKASEAVSSAGKSAADSLRRK
ncbi:MAG: hypothetical protein JJE34_04905 [Alphaproteobacteria bacterium]|nr:hypothetical protein [Alphaproteobacteria bacterium]